jgi:predicted  nucleic acid-binding Zn-ribbon protein
MTGKEIAQLVDELHRIHRQVVDINYRERRLKRAVAVAEGALDDAKKELKAKQDTLQDLHLDARNKEREAASASQELERRKEQLNLAKSDREFEALKLQIQLEENKNDTLADLTLEVLEAIDSLSEEIKLAETKFQEAEETFAKAQDALSQSVPKLQSEMEHTQQRLKDAESRLPRELAGVYVRCVKEFGGEDAFAPLANGVYCGSCNRQIPIEIVMKVCSGDSLCCSACGRLLYMPEGYTI